MQRQHGLTLLELLVVLTIIGFGLAGVSLSLRDSSQTQLEREAQRLIAVLENARAQSRTSGMALIWQSTEDGFSIRPATGTSMATRTETWLAAGTHTVANTAMPFNAVVLGPDPIIAPARITLRITTTNNAKPAPTLSLGTDGLRPFQVVP